MKLFRPRLVEELYKYFGSYEEVNKALQGVQFGDQDIADIYEYGTDLRDAFRWHDTSQGFNYWLDIHEWLIAQGGI